MSLEQRDIDEAYRCYFIAKKWKDQITKKDLNNRVFSYIIMKTFTAIVQKEDNMYVATCPEIGTVSQGNTIEESLLNLKEATELYLEEFPTKEKNAPLLTTFEVAEGEA